MPLHPIRSAPPPPPPRRELSNNNINPKKNQETSSRNLNNNLQKISTITVPTIIRPTTASKKKKAPPPRPAPPKKYQPKPDLLNHLNFYQENLNTPTVDILLNQKFLTEELETNFPKNAGISKGQKSDCLIDLDSPIFPQNYKSNTSSYPPKSLLDLDNIEEVPHVPLLEAFGPKPITLFPPITPNVNNEKRVLFNTEDKNISLELPAPVSQSTNVPSSNLSSKEYSSSNQQASTTKRKFVSALYDFVGEMEEDLSFKADDEIIFLHEINSDWWYGELYGKQGQFPSKFVKEMPAVSNYIGVETGTQDNKKAIALYDFLETEKGDLSFKAGDEITILYEINSDWLFGELNGKQGQFPANFIQDESSNIGPSQENSEKGNNEYPPPLGVFVALYNFKAEQPGDLELQEGDKVLVTECINDEWWQGMITPAGNTGIFPATFVKRIDS